MTRPFRLRHATALEQEYRARLFRRARAIAVAHHEATRTDGYLAPMALAAFLTLAQQIGRFVGRQVDAEIRRAAAAGKPVRPPAARETVPGLVWTAPPPGEVAFYQTWSDVERRAVEDSESQLAAELSQGMPDALARALTRATGIASRGVTWATGAVVEQRQRAAGIRGYVWRGMLDERERDTHVELEDTFHRWDDPPPSEANGDRNHPGQAPNCRCYAEPAYDAE